MGVLAIRPGESISAEDPEQLHFLETMAAEIGAALTSTELSEAAGRAEAQVEAERLRNLILSSFSIDIREPLAQISRVTNRLLEIEPLPAIIRQGIQEIRDRTSRLGSVAEELPKMIEARTQQLAESGAKTPTGPVDVVPAPVSAANAPAQPRLRVGDILDRRTVLVIDGPQTKENILKQLIATLDIPNPAEALRLVMEREKAGSTMIGSGLVIPHARIPAIAKVKAALGIVRDGIVDWSAEGDAGPIQLVMLFVSPIEDFLAHLAFLGAVTRLFREEGLTQEFVGVTAAESVLDRIRKAEEAIP